MLEEGSEGSAAGRLSFKTRVLEREKLTQEIKGKTFQCQWQPGKKRVWEVDKVLEIQSEFIFPGGLYPPGKKIRGMSEMEPGKVAEIVNSHGES